MLKIHSGGEQLALALQLTQLIGVSFLSLWQEMLTSARWCSYEQKRLLSVKGVR